MARIAHNAGLRLFAAVLVLLLRPCLIFLSAEFLTSQSNRHARIEYIEDDEAISNLAFGRRAFSAPVRHAVIDPPTLAGPSAAIAWQFSSRQDHSPQPFADLRASLATILAGRSPPLL